VLVFKQLITFLKRALPLAIVLLLILIFYIDLCVIVKLSFLTKLCLNMVMLNMVISPGSTVVERSTHSPGVKGSKPASGNEREKIAKRIFRTDIALLPVNSLRNTCALSPTLSRLPLISNNQNVV